MEGKSDKEVELAVMAAVMLRQRVWGVDVMID